MATSGGGDVPIYVLMSGHMHSVFLAVKCENIALKKGMC